MGIMNYQLSIMNYELSIINYQLGVGRINKSNFLNLEFRI
ncbi:hypothetical protein N0824_00448 [Microcystis sp. 0824]|nr:hypothetical protein N0824_00448 [Microcystis sp. 0824]